MNGNTDQAVKRKERRSGKLPGRYIFLIIVLAAYGICAVFSQDLVLEALHGFYQMALKVIPILAFVFVLLVLSDMFLQPEGIERYLGKDSGLKGWFFAIIGGVLIMGPPYVLYPMLAKLRAMGAREGLVAVFLYNRNVKIPFLPAMVVYLGLNYTFVLSVYISIFSVINGLLIEWMLDRTSGKEHL